MQDPLILAKQFVNSTNQHIFLTGKAGTGKTTFLRNLAETTYKNFVIVAPTGIAALNAKGVTIHSQFLFPLGTFIPVNDPVGNISDSDRIFTQNTLARKHPLNAVRKQVLRNMDLLIIDEVSMLRADVLDAIDYRLKSAKGNFRESFGGVQVLMIGDLFQLSPIVNDWEWNYLKPFYPSMLFYNAQVFSQAPVVYIELTKIFRQKDEKFISILNNLRNNQSTSEDIDALNAHYVEDVSTVKDDAVTLTTHNRIADEINQKALDKLGGRTYTFSADITGEFPKSMFPAEENIVLKVGAQVMFIKNDSQNQEYFNGKLAKVTDLSSSKITVKFTDNNEPYTLRQEEWQNKRYSINSDTKDQEEEVIGSFMQFPIRLAWAITVHKSQGLTFDKAIVDLGQAFAPGQVYVALSRLRSLDGLILRSKLNKNLIHNNREVEAYSSRKPTMEQLQENLEQGRSYYLQKLLFQTFNFEAISKQISYFKSSKTAQTNFEEEDLNTFLSDLLKRINAEQLVARKFAGQLQQLLKGESAMLISRLNDATKYFSKKLRDFMFEILNHIARVQQFSKTKTYLNGIDEIDQLVFKKLESIVQCPVLLAQLIMEQDLEEDVELNENLVKDRLKIIEELGANMPKTTAKNKSGRKKKGSGEKKVVGETYNKTLALIEAGKSLETIAKEREMALSTIEGHAAKLIAEKKVEINKFLKKEEVAEIGNAMKGKGNSELKNAYDKLDGKYTYSQIRMVTAFYQSVNSES